MADALSTRLNKLPDPTKQDDYSARYRRELIMEWAITALENSKRKEDIIPLLKQEAPITYCYETLVKHLLSARRKTDARKAAVEGFEKTIGLLPGIAWRLASQLREMARRDKNLPLVASYRAMEFFNQPILETYRNLKKTTQAIDEWLSIRETVLHFLETGIRPDIPSTKGKKGKPPSTTKTWVLPATEIS